MSSQWLEWESEWRPVVTATFSWHRVTGREAGCRARPESE